MDGPFVNFATICSMGGSIDFLTQNTQALSNLASLHGQGFSTA